MPASKNCEDEGDIDIDDTGKNPVAIYDSTSREESKLDSTLGEQKALDCETQEPQAGPSSASCHMKSFSSSESRITSEDCSIAYFAGYLAKKCIDKFSCSLCTKWKERYVLI